MEAAPLDERYENGQSDVEKLMRRHLQTPDDVVTDEELKNLSVDAQETIPAPLTQRNT